MGPYCPAQLLVQAMQLVYCPCQQLDPPGPSAVPVRPRVDVRIAVTILLPRLASQQSQVACDRCTWQKEWTSRLQLYLSTSLHTSSGSSGCSAACSAAVSHALSNTLSPCKQVRRGFDHTCCRLSATPRLVLIILCGSDGTSGTSEYLRISSSKI